jgi:hypothetical protein
MPNTTRVVIATVPWTDTASPLMAPAVLKANLALHGIASVGLDLNAEIRHWLDDCDDRDAVLSFMLTERVKKGSRASVIAMLDYMTDRILDHDPEWVALSLLTYLSQPVTRWLCFRLRQRRPDLKIVVGGPGASTSLKSADSFANTLKRQNLIDHYIVGDGELSLPALINGNRDYAGVDDPNWQQLADLNQRPYPNFDDYRWDLYDHKWISVVGSRGCVRECTFCDIHEHWQRYQWRTGQDIFQEMVHQKHSHGINVFKFADSLVNGNQKEYHSLISLLADYNRDRDPADRIVWTGSFIIRPQDQMREHMWQLTAESGAAILSVGVESFVEHIRYHIKKKFSNQDLDFCLQMAKKYGIKLILLTIVGYATETDQDFQQQLDWITDNQRYANDPVHRVEIGSGLGILEGTWLHRHHRELNIELNPDNVAHDWVRTDIDSTPAKRMEWHQRMRRHLSDHGFKANFSKDNHSLIEEYLINKYAPIDTD